MKKPSFLFWFFTLFIVCSVGLLILVISCQAKSSEYRVTAIVLEQITYNRHDNLIKVETNCTKGYQITNNNRITKITLKY